MEWEVRKAEVRWSVSPASPAWGLNQNVSVHPQDLGQCYTPARTGIRHTESALVSVVIQRSHIRVEVIEPVIIGSWIVTSSQLDSLKFFDLNKAYGSVSYSIPSAKETCGTIVVQPLIHRRHCQIRLLAVGRYVVQGEKSGLASPRKVERRCLCSDSTMWA